jgi:hypothetical protein
MRSSSEVAGSVCRGAVNTEWYISVEVPVETRRKLDVD